MNGGSAELLAIRRLDTSGALMPAAPPCSSTPGRSC